MSEKPKLCHLIGWLLKTGIKYFDIISLVGGMQDWNYVHTNCFEITLELGCRKFPKTDLLPSFWEANKYPLLVYMGQVIYQLLFEPSFKMRKPDISLCKQ